MVYAVPYVGVPLVKLYLWRKTKGANLFILLDKNRGTWRERIRSFQRVSNPQREGTDYIYETNRI
jgi:hypothetical protein